MKKSRSILVMGFLALALLGLVASCGDDDDDDMARGVKAAPKSDLVAAEKTRAGMDELFEDPIEEACFCKCVCAPPPGGPATPKPFRVACPPIPFTCDTLNGQACTGYAPGQLPFPSLFDGISHSCHL